MKLNRKVKIKSFRQLIREGWKQEEKKLVYTLDDGGEFWFPKGLWDVLGKILDVEQCDSQYCRFRHSGIWYIHKSMILFDAGGYELE